MEGNNMTTSNEISSSVSDANLAQKMEPVIINISPTPVKVEVTPIPVNLPPSDDTQAKESNRIAKWGIIVNALLFIITLLALLLTWRGLKDSEIKDNEAKVAAHIADSIGHIKDSISFRRDTFTLSLAQKSLEAQIQSLNETHMQFEIENRPIIQVVNFGLDSLNQNERVLCEIINNGKLPAKILKCSFHLTHLSGYASYIPARPYTKKEQFHFEQSLYSNAAFPISLGEEFGVNAQDVRAFASGEGQIWFFGEIEYLCAYTKKRFRLRIVTVLQFAGKKLKIFAKENEDNLVK